MNEKKVKSLKMAESVEIDGKIWTRAPGCLIIEVSVKKPVFSGSGCGYSSLFNMQKGGEVSIGGHVDCSVNFFSNMVKIAVPDSFFHGGE
jgi:hypothetical protein